jgi:hypothetical protein
MVFWIGTPCKLDVVTNVLVDLLAPTMKAEAASFTAIEKSQVTESELG